jgi:hypothetical protein
VSISEALLNNKWEVRVNKIHCNMSVSYLLTEELNLYQVGEGYYNIVSVMDCLERVLFKMSFYYSQISTIYNHHHL